MAITKRFKVSFEMTIVADSETEQVFNERIKELAHMVKANDPKVTPQEREMLVQALTHGAGGAVAFVAKQFIRNAIKELCDEQRREGLKFSPATVREVK